jgi:LPXTG-motif cell wall-anchored protein
MPVRLATLLAALVLALTAPAAALGQGAGDDQYTDPFGSGQNDSGDQPAQNPEAPTSSGDEPAAAPAPAPTAAATAPEASSAGQAQLPYTGSDAGLLALTGALLLAGGIALRLRVSSPGERQPRH